MNSHVPESPNSLCQEKVHFCTGWHKDNLHLVSKQPVCLFSGWAENMHTHEGTIGLGRNGQEHSRDDHAHELKTLGKFMRCTYALRSESRQETIYISMHLHVTANWRCRCETTAGISKKIHTPLAKKENGFHMHISITDLNQALRFNTTYPLYTF